MDYTPVRDCIEYMAWRIGRLEIEEAHKMEVCLEHWFNTHLEDADSNGERGEFYRLRKLLKVLEHQTYAFEEPESHRFNEYMEKGY